MAVVTIRQRPFQIEGKTVHEVGLPWHFGWVHPKDGGDSANLMDTPEASRLGVHRAFLYDEEQGEYEKFRPYGLPNADWLREVKQHLQRRADHVD